MASISKIRSDSDRISNLPNNLITHILSFLSTEDTVKTSLLSTSWNQQWKLVPLISLEDCEPHKSKQSFVNFVYRVLRHKVSPLNLFQLMGDKGYDPINVKEWISMALSLHVKEIDVSTAMPSHCRLPDCLYSSKTLVVLKLYGKFVFEVPDKVCLESLKIFHYGVYEYDVDEDFEFSDVDDFELSASFTRLVLSCPVLEELRIIGRLEQDVKVLNISSLVLKRLILKDLYKDDPAYELVINTPNLQYLEHSDKRGLPSYNLNTLHCLDTACFNLYLPDDQFDELIPARSMADLVVAISNIRALYIYDNAFEALYCNVLPNFELPKFNRLISLELNYYIQSEAAGFSLLTAFLQSSPQLESLSFRLDCSYEMTWQPPADVPFCMIYNLKVIKADSLTDMDDELEQLLEVLTYFLEKAKCLEELVILDAKRKSPKFIKKVSMLSRASNLCKIELA